jgi:hypothetical protein
MGQLPFVKSIQNSYHAMKTIIQSIFAIMLLLEEWLWDVLTDFEHCLTAWFHLERMEQWLANAHPWVAMTAFVIPTLLFLPVEFAALSLSASGQVLEGMTLHIISQTFSTLLVSWMFAITREQLMTFGWFAVLYQTITRWLNWSHERMRETGAYQRALKLKLAAHAKLVEWLHNATPNPAGFQ